MSINKGAYLVFEAKRAAEVAPGVGKHMDMALVTKGNVRILTDAEIDILDDIYRERTAPHSDTAATSIAKLPFEKGESKS